MMKETEMQLDTVEIVRQRLADGRTIADSDVHKLVAEIDRLKESLSIADAACRTYWGWEYGHDLDDDIPDSSLLMKWRHDYVKR
jgi:hypothetical protein